MEQVTLPFELKPISSQYLDHTYALGIIEANARMQQIDIMPWVCRKFISCRFSLKQDDLNRFVIGKFNLVDECKTVELPLHIPKNDVFPNNSDNIIEIIKLLIQNCRKF